MRWISKIPALGHPRRRDEEVAEGLRSEALTMQLLKRLTTIPLLVVYSFDASLDNAIKCPFILVEQIDGKSLSNV